MEEFAMSKAFILIAALCGAGLTQELQAGHGHNHGHHNHGHNHHNHGSGWGGGYGNSWGYVSPGYGGYYGSYGRYHNTSHWDYHPTTIVPHRGHYHVIPGHYDWHNTGHWHH